MASFGKQTVEAVLERMKLFLGVHTEGDVAERLGITKQTMSNWKFRGTLDIALIKETVPDISLDWLLEGLGEPALKQLEARLIRAHNDAFQPIRSVLEKVEEYEVKKNKFKRDKTLIPILYSSLDKSDTYEVHDEIKGMFEPFIYFNEYTIVVYMNNSIKGKIEVDEGDYMVVSTNRERMNNNIVLVSIEERFEFMKFIKDKSGEYLESLDGKSKNPFKYDGLFEIEGVVIAIFKKMI